MEWTTDHILFFLAPPWTWAATGGLPETETESVRYASLAPGAAGEDQEDVHCRKRKYKDP